ncbi:two-component sensor histidine kinase [Janthinobacterium sp. BJB412]|nr:two-component sensor histidine kinase [Janthinobacterium sp. BJB412]
MPRLYFRFYIALLGSLLLFALAVTLLWHRAGGPVERADATLAQLVQNMLPPAAAPAAEQQAALVRLAQGVDGDMTLYRADWTALASIGKGVPRLQWGAGARPGRFPATDLRLADGRHLLSSKPLGFARPRALLHTALVALALAIGVAAFPLVRHLTKRLERLQHGVESLGAGDLAARVKVEGKDEVARLAQSFNRAADQIEQLVGAHKTLLANASHELRTPLARIRLALELVKDTVDAKRRAGLEQDIAELDQLLDEILLASRLGAVNDGMVLETVAPLALAAEECAHYDEVRLEGTPAAAAALLRGDARLLRRLLRNLLENAQRHGRAPTQVRLDADAAQLNIRVWDAGPGVPEGEWERIFEPFYRRGGTRDNGGAGLGLALVRQIARRHGGEARCAAIDDGRSGFVVTLPLLAV